MRSSRNLTGITWLLILVLLPWLIDYWNYGEQWKQDRRDDELFEQYDCSPPEKCVADFDGDGMPARMEVVACDGRDYGCLIALEGGKEVLRLKHDSTDGTLRTHAAVRQLESVASRLLIYDGVSRSQPLRAAFAWDGEKLKLVRPSEFEQRIIAAMAAHDDTGGWNQRTVFRDFKRYFSFLAYYLLLLVLTCVLWAGKYQPWKGVPPRNSQPQGRRLSQ